MLCPICYGSGGRLERDIEGDGIWAMPVERFEPCPDCAGAGLCPGCGAGGLPLDADINEFTCEACGWTVDWDVMTHGPEPDY